jgi:hypothetical protein
MTRPANRTIRQRRIGCLWPLVGALIGLVAAIVVLGLGPVLRSGWGDQGPTSPLLVRLPAPTTTGTPAATATLQPTETAPAAEQGGPFQVGDLIEVFGTGGDGVRLRASPSLESQIKGLGQDGEIYQVLEGPTEAFGYEWWRIALIEDTARQGWAVGTFLRALQ